MALPETTDIGTIILGPYASVVENHDPYVFPIEKNPPIKTGRTKVFPGHVTLGPTDPDREDTLTTFNVMDLSGGSGIFRINPSSDLQNYWWGVASVEGTDGMTSGREAIMRQPDSFTGDCTPLGRIGENTYALWGKAIHLWDPDARTFGAALDDITTAGALASSEGIVSFNGRMFFPLGASGYSYVSETAGTLGSVVEITGAATPAYPTGGAAHATTNPKVLAFAVHQDMLWALTTEADGYHIVTSATGNNNDWDWEDHAAQNKDPGRYIFIEKSFEPKALAVFPNQQNTLSLWVSGRRGLKIYDKSEMSWVDTNLNNVPPHPDFGRAMAVFRPGEALHISGGGGDIIQYTLGGTVIPASGPGGTKEGMPATKQGSAISFATDLFHLYALYKSIPAPTSTDTILEDTDGDDPIYVPQFSSETILMSNNGKGWHPVWESGRAEPSSDQGTPTKVVVSDATKDDDTTDYRVFWGVGEECWTMTCRLATHSSRQAIRAGTGERFRQESYIEFGEFYGGSIAIPKLSSHVALHMDHATNIDYVEYDYYTDRDHSGTSDPWITLGRADHDADDELDPRIVLPFGGLLADGSEPSDPDDIAFSEGVAWRWIRQRLRWVAGTATAPPILTSFTLAFMPLTQDASTKAYSIPLPVELDEKTSKTAEVIINTLEALLSPTVRNERFLYMQEGTRRFRCLLSSLTYAAAYTNDQRGVLNITLIQIPTGKTGLIGER